MSDRGLATALVIVFVALTPTWADAVQLWQQDDEGLKRPIVVWYVALILVACSYWRVLK